MQVLNNVTFKCRELWSVKICKPLAQGIVVMRERKKLDALFSMCCHSCYGKNAGRSGEFLMHNMLTFFISVLVNKPFSY